MRSFPEVPRELRLAVMDRAMVQVLQQRLSERLTATGGKASRRASSIDANMASIRASRSKIASRNAAPVAPSRMWLPFSPAQ